MRIKISFRAIVTLLSLVIAILLGLTRISDPEIIEIMRLKYFDILQKKNPRETKGNTYSVELHDKGFECDCPGFGFHGYCKHSRAVVAQVEGVMK